MGASGWFYYVPYQEDLEAAFQEFRRHVFLTDEYAHFWQGEWVVAIDGEEIDISRMQEVVEQEDGSLHPVPPLLFTRTVEEHMAEAVKRSEPEGTHSILDIRHLLTDERYFSDGSLPEEVIQQIFAGVKPTKTIIEAIVSHQQVWQHLKGWFEAERMNLIHGKQPDVFHFSEEFLAFFTPEQSQEEIVAALVSRVDFWQEMYPCLCFVIEQLAQLSRYGTVRPLSAEKLMRFFGSEKPTRAAIEAAFEQQEIWNLYHSSGFYAIVYRNNVPHEIVFAGVMGD